MGPADDLVTAKKLAQLFECLPAIHHLDISENFINDAKFIEMIPSLVNMKQLKSFSCNRSSISHEGFNKYFDALRSQYLNGLDPSVDDNFMEMQKCSDEINLKVCDLESIELTGCNLGDLGLEALLGLLMQNPFMFQKLRNVNIVANKMTSQSMQCLQVFINNFKNASKAEYRKDYLPQLL